MQPGFLRHRVLGIIDPITLVTLGLLSLTIIGTSIATQIIKVNTENRTQAATKCTDKSVKDCGGCSPAGYKCKVIKNECRTSETKCPTPTPRSGGTAPAPTSPPSSGTCSCPHSCTPGVGGCWWGSGPYPPCNPACCSLGACPTYRPTATPTLPKPIATTRTQPTDIPVKIPITSSPTRTKTPIPTRTKTPIPTRTNTPKPNPSPTLGAPRTTICTVGQYHCVGASPISRLEICQNYWNPVNNRNEPHWVFIKYCSTCTNGSSSCTTYTPPPKSPTKIPTKAPAIQVPITPSRTPTISSTFACSPNGATRCNSNYLETCTSGRWYSPKLCSAGCQTVREDMRTFGQCKPTPTPSTNPPVRPSSLPTLKSGVYPTLPKASATPTQIAPPIFTGKRCHYDMIRRADSICTFRFGIGWDCEPCPNGGLCMGADFRAYCGPPVFTPPTGGPTTTPIPTPLPSPGTIIENRCKPQPINGWRCQNNQLQQCVEIGLGMDQQIYKWVSTWEWRTWQDCNKDNLICDSIDRECIQPPPTNTPRPTFTPRPLSSPTQALKPSPCPKEIVDELGKSCRTSPILNADLQCLSNQTRYYCCAFNEPHLNPQTNTCEHSLTPTPIPTKPTVPGTSELCENPRGYDRNCRKYPKGTVTNAVDCNKNAAENADEAGLYWFCCESANQSISKLDKLCCTVTGFRSLNGTCMPICLDPGSPYANSPPCENYGVDTETKCAYAKQNDYCKVPTGDRDDHDRSFTECNFSGQKLLCCLNNTEPHKIQIAGGYQWTCQDPNDIPVAQNPPSTSPSNIKNCTNNALPYCAGTKVISALEPCIKTNADDAYGEQGSIIYCCPNGEIIDWTIKSCAPNSSTSTITSGLDTLGTFLDIANIVSILFL